MIKNLICFGFYNKPDEKLGENGRKLAWLVPTLLIGLAVGYAAAHSF